MALSKPIIRTPLIRFAKHILTKSNVHRNASLNIRTFANTTKNELKGTSAISSSYVQLRQTHSSPRVSKFNQPLLPKTIQLRRFSKQKGEDEENGKQHETVLDSFFAQFTRKSGDGESGNGMMLFGGIFGAILILILGSSAVTVIPAGHMGLLDLFGKVNESHLNSGLSLKNPLARVVKISLQTQVESVMTEVPSKEGLLVKLEIALQYHLDPKQVRDLYINVGSNYEDVLLRPQFLSTIRQVTSSYDAKALYTSESRSKMSLEIKDHLNETLKERGIVIEDAPMKKIILPDKLATSIELKLSAEQESQRMEFILQKERLEAERKAIEAKGIAAFQKIVAEGVSEQLLKWKGIEATERLAESNNAKIVIIGGKDGLPIILNPEKK